jgi:hypothetical protein
VRHCPKFLEVETNKRPWSRSSTPSEDATKEEGNPVSARPRIEKRPMGRKQAKERLKIGVRRCWTIQGSHCRIDLGQEGGEEIKGGGEKN